MPLLVLALLVFVLLAFAGVVLLSFALRYRAGTVRRQGRPWLATFTMWMTCFSAIMFLIFATTLSIWIPDAARIALAGIFFGCLAGLVGLALTRWENGVNGIYYTPNRWLALLVTLILTASLIYRWWRSLHPAIVSSSSPWFLTASTRQLSLAIGAGMIGYYLAYNVGLRFRLAQHARRIRS